MDMTAYRVEYFDNAHHVMTFKDRSLDSIRKSIATGRVGRLSASGTTRIYRTDVKDIQPGTWFKLIGDMYKDANGTVYWRSFPEAKTYRVSKTNGKLLDYDKYWRHI